MSEISYLYARFPLVPLITEDVRAQFVDELFYGLSIERQNRIKAYARHEMTARSEEGNKARSDIQILQKQYKRKVHNYLRGDLLFYDAFLDFSQVSEPEKIMIINKLMSLIPPLRQEALVKYVLREIPERSELGKKARVDFQTLKNRYVKFVNERFKKTIYDQFPSYDEVSIEYKKVIVDLILGRMAPERLDRIYKLLAGDINSSSVLGKKAYNDLQILIHQYERYIAKMKMWLGEFKAEIYDMVGVTFSDELDFFDTHLLYVRLDRLEKMFRHGTEIRSRVYKSYMRTVLQEIILRDPSISFNDLVLEYERETLEYLENEREDKISKY